MGLFKQLKDMKQMTEQAPDMIRQAQSMGAQAQEFAAAQQAAGQAQMKSAVYGNEAAETGPDFEPIGGVSLEMYAEISKGLAAYGYDQSKAAEVAASKGVAPDAWTEASTGWPARMKSNRAVGQRFNHYYTAG
jgi:hypothetical protein